MKKIDSGPSDIDCCLGGSVVGGEVSRCSSGLLRIYEPNSIRMVRDGTTLVRGTLKILSVELEKQETWQVLLLGSSSRGEVRFRPANHGARVRTLYKSEVLIVPPAVKISVEVSRAGTAALMSLSLSTAPAVDWPVALGLNEIDTTNGLFFEALRHLQKVSRDPFWASHELNCSVARVFAILVIEFGTQKMRKRGQVFIGRSKKTLKLVEDYLDAHLTERISISELARVAGVSPRQFRRLFRIATEMSPREYLWSRRAAYGKTLLSKGDHNVAEAAVAAGFSDQTHMNRHFRSIYGVPPSTFLPRRPFQPKD